MNIEKALLGMHKEFDHVNAAIAKCEELAALATIKSRRGRKSMGVERVEVSARMKRYWAAKRKTLKDPEAG